MKALGYNGSKKKVIYRPNTFQCLEYSLIQTPKIGRGKQLYFKNRFRSDIFEITFQIIKKNNKYLCTINNELYAERGFLLSWFQFFG